MWETPPRSPTIVGIAVETIVWSRLDISMPASRAEKIRLIRRRVRTIGGGATASLGRESVGGACNGSPRSFVGAAGARHRRSGRRRPLRWFGKLVVGSARRGGQPGGEQVPRLVDEAGQRGGEPGGEPAAQGRG